MSFSGKVVCSRTGNNTTVDKCKQCEDLFGVLPYNSFVLCKRGVKKDEVIKKEHNNNYKGGK